MEQQAEPWQRPAGWYQVGSGWVAYWDGGAWTGDRIRPEQLATLTKPAAPPPPMAPPPPAARTAGPPSQRTPLLLGGLVCLGIVGIMVLGALQRQGIIDTPTTTTTLDPFTDAAENYQDVQPYQVESCCAALVVVLEGPEDDRPGKLEPASSRLDIQAFGRLLAQLGMPPGTAARMSGTRALDGTQSAEGEHARATWTFHPDQGLRVVFEPT